MPQLIFSLDKSSNEKGASEGKVYKAIASTAALDRDSEVLIPKGAVTEQFMKNPVMLMIHNYRQVPVGKVLSIEVAKEAVSFTFEFADSKDGNELKGLYDTGFMNAFSVGLYPLKSMWIDEQTPNTFEVVNTDGTKDTFDLTKYPKKPQRVVLSWELLEISPVPVPSNPEALLIRAKEDVQRKSVEGHISKAAAQILEHKLDIQIAAIKSTFEKELEDLEATSSSNVIEYAKSPVDLEKSWDPMRAQASLAKWASSDNSGEKDTLDWGEFSRGFAYVDISQAEKLSSYKFAHHHVIDKEVVAIFKGVAKSMSQLLSNKEMWGDDAKSIYSHLAEHYKDAEQVCPSFDEEYTEEQLKAIGDAADWTISKEGEDEGSSDPSSAENHSESEKVSDERVLLEKILNNLIEFDEVIRLRFTLMADTLDTIQGDIKSLKTQEQKSGEEEEGEGEGDPTPEQEPVIEDQLKSLSAFLKNTE